ncbi:MAG: phosphotransferase, partial [Microbacterium sp.]
DIDGAPEVTGLLDWHGLSVGDPATDLQWLASAPTAADDVYEAYVAASGRAPDGRARERARLYAELEFAKWLIHGHETGRKDVVDDATALLESLAAGVDGDDLVTDAALDVDDAIALLARVPESPESLRDTSMHTDAYDAEELSLWIPDVPDAPAPPGSQAGSAPVAQEWHADEVSTSPIVLPIAVDASAVGAADAGADDAPDAAEDAVGDAQRASDAALRRWMSQ